MMPVAWLALSSLKAESEYAVWPVRVFPETPQWSNYRDALTMGDFEKYAWNSVFLATTVAVLNLAASALAGYAFARFQVPGRNVVFALVVATLMIPGISTMVPQFILYSRLGMYNTYWPWILPAITATPFHIFMFRQFFVSMPRELEDAAEVDGCGPFRIFWQIFLPNSLPIIATSFIFSFRGVWSEWLRPKIYLQLSKTTLAVALDQIYRDPHGNRIVPVTLAGFTMFTIPLIIMFFLTQRYIMQGVVTSGLKGI
jgi:multiple sugar transport system permease protein